MKVYDGKTLCSKCGHGSYVKSYNKYAERLTVECYACKHSWFELPKDYDKSTEHRCNEMVETGDTYKKDANGWALWRHGVRWNTPNGKHPHCEWCGEALDGRKELKLRIEVDTEEFDAVIKEFNEALCDVIRLVP